MKVKFFVFDGPFEKKGAGIEGFEAAINSWLAEHPSVRVEQIQQSSNGGGLDHTKVVVSVWYHEQS